MKLTGNIEISGLTDIVIEKRLHWIYNTSEKEWFMAIKKTGNNYYVWKDREAMAKMIRGYLSNPLYRAWISSGEIDGDFIVTLNIVKREISKPSKSIIIEEYILPANESKEHLRTRPINFYKIQF